MCVSENVRNLVSRRWLGTWLGCDCRLFLSTFRQPTNYTETRE